MENAAKFLAERLTPDLANAIAHRNTLLHSADSLRDLLSTINKLRKHAVAGTRYKQLVDIGEKHFVEAEANDPSFIFLKIELGFYVQVSLDEAPDLLDKQGKVLQGYVSAVALLKHLLFHFDMIPVHLHNRLFERFESDGFIWDAAHARVVTGKSKPQPQKSLS